MYFKFNKHLSIILNWGKLMLLAWMISESFDTHTFNKLN